MATWSILSGLKTVISFVTAVGVVSAFIVLYPRELTVTFSEILSYQY